jgi:hypothetical protein
LEPAQIARVLSPAPRRSSFGLFQDFRSARFQGVFFYTLPDLVGQVFQFPPQSPFGAVWVDQFEH